MTTDRTLLQQAERIIALRRNVGNAAYDEQAETVLDAIRARLAEPERTVTLPPLPDRQVLCRVMPDDYRYGNVYGFTADQMRNYARECLRVAGIEVSK